MKKELHIKHAQRPETGYLVAFRDYTIKDVRYQWRCVTLTPKTQEESIEYAEKYAKDNRSEFLQTVCNCGTDF